MMSNLIMFLLMDFSLLRDVTLNLSKLNLKIQGKDKDTVQIDSSIGAIK